MKTFEEELQQQLRPLHSMNCHSNASWFKGQKEPFPCDCFMLQLIPALIAAHQAEMDRVEDEVIDAGKLVGEGRDENIGLILSTIAVMTGQQRARYKAIKEGE